MATSGQIKGITIKIEGDTSGLAKDLQSVNSDIKKTSAALKDVESALKLDPGNVELLAQKQELLNKQIEQTRTKLELERQAATKAKEALDIGKISQEEYASLQAEVSKTSKSLDQLETEAEQSQTALDGAGKEAKDTAGDMQDMGDSVGGLGSVFGNLGVSIASWSNIASTAISIVSKAIEKIKELAKKAFEIIKGAAEGIYNAFKKLGEIAGKTVSSFLDLSGEVADFTDEIDKNSKKAGMAASAYQKWDYIMKINGTSMSENMQAFKKLTNSIDDARNGSKNATALFKELGISMKDLKTLSPEEIFEKSVYALQNVSDETRQAALANDLFGRSGQALQPLLDSTSEATKELADQAERYGLILDDKTISAGVKYKDSLTLLNATLDTLKANLIGGFLPGLAQVTQGLAGLIAGVDGADQDVKKGVDSMVENFNKVAPAVLSALNEAIPQLIPLANSLVMTLVTGIIENLPEVINGATQIITTLIEGLTNEENIDALVTGVIAIMNAIVDGLLAVLDLLIDPVFQIIDKILTELLKEENLTRITENAGKILRKICEGITKVLPELVPVITDIINTIITELQKPENRQHLETTATVLFSVIILSITNVGNALWKYFWNEFLPSLFNIFNEFRTKIFAQALAWGTDLIKGFISGIKSMWDKLVGTLKNVGSTIKSYLGFSVPDLGPLSDFDKSGPDMIQLFAKGMIDELPTLQAAVQKTANVVNTGLDQPTDYTAALRGISGQIAGLTAGAGNTGPTIINVQVGSTTLAQAVISAQQMENYRSGGN